MNPTAARTRRAALAAFFSFAAALGLGATRAEASLPRSADAVSEASTPLPLELPKPAPPSFDPRLGFASSLELLAPEAEVPRFRLFDDAGERRCEITYARNNPLKYVDPDGRAEYPASVLLGRGAPQSAEAAARAARGAPIANVLLRRDFGRRAPLTADGNGTFGVGDRVGVKLDLLRGDVSLSQSGGVGGGPDENRVISYAEKASLSLSTGEVSMAQGAQVSLGLLTAESYDNGDATVTVQAKKYLAVQVGVNSFNLMSAINSFGETVMALVGNLMEAAGVTPGSPGEPPTKPVCTDPVQGGCR